MPVDKTSRILGQVRDRQVSFVCSWNFTRLRCGFRLVQEGIVLLKTLISANKITLLLPGVAERRIENTVALFHI